MSYFRQLLSDIGVAVGISATFSSVTLGMVAAKVLSDRGYLIGAVLALLIALTVYIFGLIRLFK